MFFPLVKALYIYTSLNKEECFFEELAIGSHASGHSKVEVEDYLTKQFIIHNKIETHISVFHEQKFINQNTKSHGEFSFTATHPGKHKICFTISGPKEIGRIRLHFDFVLGKEHSQTKIQDLVERAVEIKNEQRYQRERESKFRDLSDIVNARILNWTIVQFLVMALCCFWQMNHLKKFFYKIKVV